MAQFIHRTSVALLLLTSSLAPGAAFSQTNDPVPPRTLNGHRFIPSIQIEDPFITTMVGTQTGGGYASKVARDIESEVLDSLVNALVGDLAFLGLGFEFQYAPTDWLALRASASGAARLGTGAQSVLAEGVTSVFGFSFKAAARVLQTQRWLFSGTLRLEPSTQYRLDVLTFARRAIEEGQVAEDNSMVIRSEGVGGALGLRGAYAPVPWIGFLFGGEVGYSDTFSEEGRRDPVWQIGGAASFDLNPLIGFPLGILATAQEDRFVLSNSDLAESATSIGWGIAYTGREDFSLGLETLHLRSPLVRSERRMNAVLVDFTIRYFF